MIISLSEKASANYQSRGIQVTFSPEDVGLNPEEYRGRTSLLWWTLNLRAHERFLSIIFLEGRLTQEQMSAELEPHRRMLTHVESQPGVT